MLPRPLETPQEPVQTWYPRTPVEQARLPLQHLYEKYESFLGLVDGIPLPCIESIRQLLVLAEDDKYVYRLFTEKARIELAQMNKIFLREAKQSESPATIEAHQEVFLELQDLLDDAWYAKALLRMMELAPRTTATSGDVVLLPSEQSGVRRVL